MKIKCSVEILTLNSEKTLERCLDSVRDFDDIIIIDGNSTDRTVEISKKYGARIIPQTNSKDKNIKIADFSAVRNIGIKNAKHDWFLFLDSDEYLSSGVIDEIRSLVEKGKENEFFIYKIPRKMIVNGEIIERSSTYPNYQIRFFYLSAVDGFVKKVHEKLKIKAGFNIGVLKYPEYVPMDDIDNMKKKWRGYANLYAKNKEFPPSLFIKRAWKSFAVFLKYLIKYIIVFFKGSGKRMPFSYEWYNAYYHIMIIKEIFLKMLKKDRY